MTVETSATSVDSVMPLTAARPMSVVKTYSSFDELPPVYGPFFERNAVSSFYQSLAWYRNFVGMALDPEDRMSIYALEQDGFPLAALPVRYKKRPGVFGLRALSSLSNYYTTLFEPLIDPNHGAQDTLGPLARTLCAGRPAWDVVNLKPMLRDSPVFSELVQSLEHAGMVVQTYFCAGNWYCPLDGKSYQEYLAGLKSSVRNIARSKNKKLERSGRARVEITTGSDGLDAAIEAYEKVYAASWKVPEPYPLFVPGLIRTCAEMGWLRLGVAYVDNVPAAAQLWIVKDGKAAIYKIAYDRKFADLSVGSYLTMQLMERAIDGDRVREVDYLSGDDRYKRDWMSHRRELWGILAMNPRTIGGLLSIVRHVGGRALKTTARKMARRTPKPEGNPG